MLGGFLLIEPDYVPPLDPGFRPAVLANHIYSNQVRRSAAGVPLVLGLERADGSVSRFETEVFPESHPRAKADLRYVERLVKFLLWQRGGWKVYVGGPEFIARYIAETYSPSGERAFDYNFMGADIYERTFTVVSCSPDDVPPERENTQPLGRHLDGCRIGFDLGASDRKVSAVVDGKTVFSDEVVWEPLLTSKFGARHGEVSAAWIWHRVHRVSRSRRTLFHAQVMGAFPGGTAALLQRLRQRIEARGATVHLGAPVHAVLSAGGRARGVRVGGAGPRELEADAVVLAAPLPRTAALLPDDNVVPGWTRGAETRFFNPDNLFEYIDGAADGYVNYGFQEVVTAEYNNPQRP
jgi:hypothetical protein